MKAKTPDRLIKPTENSYRCPACGEMVDNTDRESVRVHHDHVLHPRFDRFVTLPIPPAKIFRPVGTKPAF
jgi:hypothetical protein